MAVKTAQVMYDKVLLNLDDVKINTKVLKGEDGIISNLLEIKSRQVPAQATVFSLPGFEVKVEAITDDSGTADTSDDKTRLKVSVKTSPVPLLKHLASETDNTWDDKFVEKLAAGQKIFGAATGFLGTFLPAVMDNAKKDLRQTAGTETADETQDGEVPS